MDKLLKLLRPKWWITALLVLLSAGGLIWVFRGDYGESWFSYPIYVIAFYTLCVVCVQLIPDGIRLLSASRKKRQNRTEEEKDKHFRFSLYRSLSINLAFGVFYLVSGILTDSVWTISNGGYYMLLSVCRSVLAICERRLLRMTDPEKRSRLSWEGFRLCGMIMLLLNLAMTVMTVQMICRERGKTYHEIMVIAMAAYTFYKLTIALVRVFQCRRNGSPIMGAARNVELMAAMMSIFSLQTAMFGAFGGEFGEKMLMNILTGTAVCLLGIFGAVGMTIHGGKRLKQLGEMKNGKQ